MDNDDERDSAEEAFNRELNENPEGHPMLSRADVDRCGAGQGEKCCAFMMVDYRGMVCGRDDPELQPLIANIRVMVDTGMMGAKRTPDAQYPHCQL